MIYRILPLIFLFSCKIFALDLREQWEWKNDRLYDNRPRSPSGLISDIQLLSVDLRSAVRKLKTLYIRTGTGLHEEERRRAHREFLRALELRRELYERFFELERHEREEKVDQILREELTRLEKDLENWASLNATITPLTHLIRRMKLRPRVVLAQRKFYDQKQKNWVLGEELIEKIRIAWRAWRLRTMATYLQAEKILRPITEDVPDFLPAWFWLSRVLFDMEKVPEATGILERLVRVDPELMQSRSLSEEFLSQESLILHSLPEESLILPEKALLPPPRPHPAQKDGILEVPYVLAMGPAQEVTGTVNFKAVFELADAETSRIFGVLGEIESSRNLEPVGPAGPLFRAAVEFFAPYDALFLHQGLTGASEDLLLQLNLPHIGGDRVAGVFHSRIRSQGFEALYLRPSLLTPVAYAHSRKQMPVSDFFETTATEPSWSSQDTQEVQLVIDGKRFLGFHLNGEKAWQARENSGPRQELKDFSAENLIVLHLSPATQPRGLAPDYTILTQGEADWFVRGQHKKGRFQQKSQHEPMVILEENGKPMELSRGSWHILAAYGEITVETRRGNSP